MISVREALEIATPEPEPPATDLSDEERIQLDALDAAVEAGCARTFNGRMFEVPVPTTFCSPAVIAELRRRYESAEGGWTTGIFPRFLEGVEEPYEVQIVFSPAVMLRQENVIKRHLRDLGERLATEAIQSLTKALRLLVRMPTRGRPHQAVQVLQKYREMAGCAIQIEAVVDEDDATMRDARVLRYLRDLDVVVTVGRHRSKVEACNGGRLRDWDVMMLASDDMVPVEDGYAVRVLSEYTARWPHLDGAIYFDDGYQHGVLCTLPILGRRLYEKMGYVYHPAYESLYCDQEQTELLRMMKRISYVPERIIEHRHPAWGRAEVDATYARNDALMERDRAVYEKRCVEYRPYGKFGFDAPPLWLSVLIASLPERRAWRDRLIDELHTQAMDLLVPREDGVRGHPLEVEILVDDRLPPATIGEKRQALLERARGHFVAFVDDDDWVASDYLRRVVGAIRRQPDVDCCELWGVRQVHDRSEPFHASFVYGQWSEAPVLKWGTWGDDEKAGVKGVHLRTPGHLNAVRRTLALEVGFAKESHAEDLDFAQRLRPLLRTEATTGDEPLYYYFSDFTGASRVR